MNTETKYNKFYAHNSFKLVWRFYS